MHATTDRGRRERAMTIGQEKADKQLAASYQYSKQDYEARLAFNSPG